MSAPLIFMGGSCLFRIRWMVIDWSGGRLRSETSPARGLVAALRVWQRRLAQYEYENEQAQRREACDAPGGRRGAGEFRPDHGAQYPRPFPRASTRSGGGLSGSGRARMLRELHVCKTLRTGLMHGERSARSRAGHGGTPRARGARRARGCRPGRRRRGRGACGRAAPRRWPHGVRPAGARVRRVVGRAQAAAVRASSRRTRTSAAGCRAHR